jgi:uncharacterized membrane protein YcaP (DUF421 family)
VDIFDLERIFVGDLPIAFTLEVIFRTGVIYVYTLLVIRLLGKRGLSQISPFEFVIIIALGSAVGDPMFYPDVPILHSMAVITFVVGLQKGLVKLSERSERFETFVESRTTRMVKDGRIELENLKREDLAPDELFASLREAGVEHLGQVKRGYLEISGRVSVLPYAADAVRPGLPLYPRRDGELPQVSRAGDVPPAEGPFACVSCGESPMFSAGSALPRCPRCASDEWVPASMGRVAAPGVTDEGDSGSGQARRRRRLPGVG